VTLVRQFQGDESSTTYQDTTVSYDGYGRVKTKHVPEQQVDVNNFASTNHTSWDYNADDTVQKITDARGVMTNFAYNNRRLVTSVVYDSSNVPASANVSAAAAASFTIDPFGIRKNLDRMLRSGECGTFVEELINRLAATTKNPFVSDYALDLFDAVANSEKGGLVRGGLADENRVGATVSGQIRSETLKSTLEVASISARVIPKNKRP
jgi:hypothetical protein